MTSVETVPVEALRYVELPSRATDRVIVAPYPSGPLYCSTLEERIRVLDEALAVCNAKLDASACLSGSLPGSDRAAECVGALESIH